MKAVAFIESNFTGIDAIRKSAAAGIKCYLITSDYEMLKSMLPHDMFDGFEGLAEIVPVKNSDDIEEVLSSVKSLSIPVDAVMTFSQFRILCAAKVAKRLGLKGADPGTLSTALNKYSVRSAMERAGAPSIKYLSLESISQVKQIAKEIGFPCILKPSKGHSSLGIQLIQNERDLFVAVVKALSKNGPGEILVEEYLDGPLFSLESMTSAPGKHIFLGFSDRVLSADFIELGATFPASPPDISAGIKLVSSALDSIGFDFGACHTEMIYTPSGPRIVEINPRPGGSGVCRLIERSLGHDVVLDFIQMYLGHDPKAQFNCHRNVTMRSILPKTSGRIIQLPTREEILRLPGIKDVWFQRRVGDFTDDSRSNFSWIVTVLAESKDGTSSVDFADSALDMISNNIIIDQIPQSLKMY